MQVGSNLLLDLLGAKADVTSRRDTDGATPLHCGKGMLDCFHTSCPVHPYGQCCLLCVGRCHNINLPDRGGYSSSAHILYLKILDTRMRCDIDRLPLGFCFLWVVCPTTEQTVCDLKGQGRLDGLYLDWAGLLAHASCLEPVKLCPRRAQSWRFCAQQYPFGTSSYVNL